MRDVRRMRLSLVIAAIAMLVLTFLYAGKRVEDRAPSNDLTGACDHRLIGIFSFRRRSALNLLGMSCACTSQSYKLARGAR